MARVHIKRLKDRWYGQAKQSNRKPDMKTLPTIIDSYEPDHSITSDREQEVLLERGKDKADSSYLPQTMSAAHSRSPRSSFTEDPLDSSVRSPLQQRDFC